MVDANHCYTTSDAFYVGHALDESGAYWFEEPVAPEDLDGYRELRAGLKVNISGGEAEFARWGWRSILENRGLDIAQPEVCALGGITEYLRVLVLAHAHFTPVINHVWGSAIAVATNLRAWLLDSANEPVASVSSDQGAASLVGGQFESVLLSLLGEHVPDAPA